MSCNKQYVVGVDSVLLAFLLGLLGGMEYVCDTAVLHVYRSIKLCMSSQTAVAVSGSHKTQPIMQSTSNGGTVGASYFGRHDSLEGLFSTFCCAVVPACALPSAQ